MSDVFHMKGYKTKKVSHYLYLNDEILRQIEMIKLLCFCKRIKFFTGKESMIEMFFLFYGIISVERK